MTLKDAKLLIVGAGQGFELIALKAHFSDVVAIQPDCEDVIDEAKPYIKKGSAVAMEFPSEYFDVVYCYHVLEHIGEYKKAIYEIHRILKKGGMFYFGVPNKNRIVAYIFNPEVPILQRIKWLFNDYRLKLIGKFENCYGAHAGFTKEELREILRPPFFSIEDKTDAYYISKYRNNPLVHIIAKVKLLKKFLWPSFYLIAKK